MTTADVIRSRIDDFAMTIAGESGRPLEDARTLLRFLATAVDSRSPAMFLDYVAWAKVVVARHGRGEPDLTGDLRALARLVHQWPDALAMVRSAAAELPEMPDDVPSLLDPHAPLWSVATEYLSAILLGNRLDAQQLVLCAVEGGATLRDIYRYVFEPVQQEIGRLWQLNRVSVAQEHFCTAATQLIMTQLYSRIFSVPKNGYRAVAMGVGGELHEVGLRIITDLLEAEGWETWYLGANVPSADAVQYCIDHKAGFLLVSVTLPPQLEHAQALIRSFRERSELGAARVVVGGRAFRTAPALWHTIGADGYAADADQCLALLDRLVR